MTTIEFTKGSGSLYEAPDVGWLKPKSMFTNDFDGGAAGVGELSLTRNWKASEYTVRDATGRVRGFHERKGWLRQQGPLEWDDIQYEFAVQGTWNSEFVLRRLNENLAVFSAKGFFQRDIEVNVLDGAHVPPGLILFGVWMFILRQRDNASASG